MKNSLLTVTEPPVNGSARILTIRLSTRAGRANIMSVYAPTLCSTADSKDQFYEELDVIVLATFPKQNNCTYWEILMQEWEPIMKHDLHVLDTMAWGK